MKKLLAILLAAAAISLAVFAAESSSETATITTTTKIAQVVIEAQSEDPVITIARERVRSIGNVIIGREMIGTTARRFSVVAAESVTLANGKTLTATEVQEAIIRFTAKWKAEDDAAASAQP